MDGLAEVLQMEGVAHAMVELGGEVKCWGLNPQGQPWRIAVDRPQAVGRSLQAIYPVENTSVCTSGNYRKTTVVNGQRVSHTLDPRTGRPVEHSLLSATVVTPSAAYADAYATVCMVLGRGRRGMDRQLAASWQAGGALFIMADSTDAYSFWATPKMRGS